MSLPSLPRLGLCCQFAEQPIRSRLTLENDDKVYTPADLGRA